MGWDLENTVIVMEGWQEGVSGESIETFRFTVFGNSNEC